MAKLSVTQSNMDLLHEVRQNNGLESVTQALHLLLDNYPLDVRKGSQELTQKELNDICPV